MSEPATNSSQRLGAALSLHQSGRFADAEREYRQILSTDEKFAPAWHLLGVLLMQTDRLQPAIQHIQHAIDLGLNDVAAYNNLGEALRAANRFDEAISSYQAALSRDSDFAPANANIGTALNETDRYGEAIPYFQKSLAKRPGHANTLFRYAQALQQQDRLHEAVQALTEAMKADSAQTYVQAAELLAATQYLLRQPTAALQTLDTALQRHPSAASLHRHRAFALLAMGDYVQGFQEHDWRLRIDAPDHHPIRNFKQPMWDGSDVKGRKLLVHYEQGFGDVIQFARYIPLLADSGAEIIAEVPAAVCPLLRSLRCDVRILPKEMLLPDFDLHISLLSLPRIFKTTYATIPWDGPYLSATESRIETMRPLVDGHAHDKPKVGLVWGGNSRPDPRRSVPWSQISELIASVKNIAWFSLQTGEQVNDLHNLPNDISIFNFADHLKDFADTAAAMTLLDLIITIDTSAAHLAGAIGAKTWTLVTAAPDWRWGLEGETTPWYPMMRLFRQQTLGDWTPVLKTVRDGLIAAHLT